MISRLQDQKSEFSRSVISNFATPRSVVRQAPMSMEFSREKYWNPFNSHNFILKNLFLNKTL